MGNDTRIFTPRFKLCQLDHFVRSQVRTNAGKLGLVVLSVSAVGLTIAAIFTSDPITASKEALTAHGNLHGWGALLGIPTSPIAATLISRDLVRNEVGPTRRLLLWAGRATWIYLAIIVLFMASMFNDTFGPDALIGCPNRSLVLAYGGWLLAVAWWAIQRKKNLNPASRSSM